MSFSLIELSSVRAAASGTAGTLAAIVLCIGSCARSSPDAEKTPGATASSGGTAAPAHATPDEGASAARSAEIFTALKARLDRRLGTVRDYTIEGVARSAGSTEGTPFTYQFSQPRYARATLGATQTVVFDGKAIVALDHQARVAARVDASVGEEPLLLALHQAFSEFACEGWRPPLLRASGIRAALVQGPDGERIQLTVPIDDERLREERLLLRADGSFLQKETIDRDGNIVAFTRVLEELRDPATGLVFPKRWQRGGGDTRIEVTVAQAVINAGIAPASFATDIPPGYAIAPAQDRAPQLEREPKKAEAQPNTPGSSP